MTNKHWQVGVVGIVILTLVFVVALELVRSERTASGERPVGYWIDQLEKADAAGRIAAADALREFRGEAQDAVPALEVASKDPDGRVRMAAARALWWIDRQAGPILLAISENLSGGDSTLSQDSFQAVGDVFFAFFWEGGEGKRLRADALIAALQHESAEVRCVAVLMLTVPDPAVMERAVPALTEALGDPDVRVRVWVVRSLGSLGPAAKEAIPALRQIADTNTLYRVGASAALWAVGWQSLVCLPGVIEEVASQDRIIRSDAVDAIKKIDPGATAP